MATDLSTSYAACRRVARQSGSSFYLSFLALPAAKRAGIEAVYAFMRRTDDITDNGGNVAAIRARLDQWRREVNTALAGTATGSDILPSLRDTVERFGIPAGLFGDVLDGVEMDLHVNRYETFDELYRYCYRVASCVGLIVLPIFGPTSAAAAGPAEACGIAFQLTNIIRDVREDAARDRIYLPRADWHQFGVTEAEIRNGPATPALRQLLRFEADRATEYYAQAAPLLGQISPDSRLTLGVMMTVYRGLLTKLERAGFDVFTRPVGLTPAEKLALAARGWWRHRGGRT